MKGRSLFNFFFLKKRGHVISPPFFPFTSHGILNLLPQPTNVLHGRTLFIIKDEGAGYGFDVWYELMRFWMDEWMNR